MDGYTALQWVRYHAARGATAPDPPAHLRGAARHAAGALERIAPLPWAGEAAGLALDLGRRLEGEHDAAVLSLYTEVRGALGRSRASRWRGLGLAGLAAEAARLEQAARARSRDATP